ncbi:MAG TPA: response regulator [Vicinamibacterales bacterium]|nr:response regulator [Vicinamibacterales bacterium]
MDTIAASLAEDADRILLVDDDTTNLDVLHHTLNGRGYRLFVARSGERAIEVARRVHPLLILLDVVMPGIDGYETCRRLKQDPETREAAVIFLSSLDETKDKVRGLEVGAVDFVSKPFQSDEVVARVNTHLTMQRLRRQLEARNAELARELAVAQEFLTDARRRVEGPLLGDSPAIRALRESIVRYAADAEILLLTGRQGTGHEAAARAVHHASPRSRQAFIHVNCALLPPGQDPGILSGAVTASESAADPHLSLLELAIHGTLYLEEIQRLPAQVQGRLADILERVEALHDAGQTGEPDVRVIAFTSALLATASGFHPKLLALLERSQLRVPALAERPEDVSEIARFFLRQHARRIGAVVETISDESLKRLRKYRWPGDVSELQSLIERAVTSAREPVLEIDSALLDEGLPFGLYRLIEKLGEGGMGEVWRARHQLLARPCAIKLIKPDLLGENKREVATERFRLEARTIAQLSSPNTVRLYDFGVTETGSFYYVMELLSGVDLASLVQRFGPLPPERAIAVLRQACRSLGEAHTAGLLHRDIKPHNLYLCRLGLDFDIVKVLDFGLVKSLREGAAHLTTEGVLTGTPGYMPPERVLGAAVDERSDLYALGCVAYWMLTGRTVFTGEPMAIMIHHARTPPKAPSKAFGLSIPDRLEQIVMACLEKAPERRPASAIELWRELGEVRLTSPWTPERAELWWREHLPDLARPSLGSDPSSDVMIAPLR